MSETCQTAGRREFQFARDTFAFANETYWNYHFDAGETSFTRRDPPPSYGHRCFVLTRAARQFFYHARFDKEQRAPDDATCRILIREIMARSPRHISDKGEQIIISGYADLHEFSEDRGSLLKAECGGAWRSYVLRSHWRMVFPISREHQRRTAESLETALKSGTPPIIHIVKFPALTINHSLMLFAFAKTDRGLDFQAYDPNNPEQPPILRFDSVTNTFSLPRNHYWAGGELDVIEIYRSWLM